MSVRFLVIFLSVLLCQQVAISAPYGFNPKIPDIQKNYDFRMFVWNVTKKEVKKYETALFYKEDEDALYFIEYPSKKDFRRLIKYDFVDDKLVSARYDFEDFTNPNPDNIVDFYNAYKKNISTGLDVTGDENFIWRNKIYQRFPEFWNGAIRSGDLKIETRWVFKQSNLATLSLSHKSPYYRLTYAVSKDSQNGMTGMLPVGNMSSFNVNP